MTQFVITGTTRGLGKSLREMLSVMGERVISINRPSLDFFHQNQTDAVAMDLSSPCKDFTDLKSRLSVMNEEVVLIMNAASIGSLGQTSEISIDSFVNAFNINFFSYVQLINELIQFSKTREFALYLVIIDTGAAYKVIPGLSAYSLSKNSLNFFCDFVESESENVKVLRFNPGVFDSEMQQVLHSFVQGIDHPYDSNEFNSPDVPARKLISELKAFISKN